MASDPTANDERVARRRRHRRRVFVVLAVILALAVLSGMIAKRIGERWIADRLAKLAGTRLGMELAVEKVSIGMGGTVVLRAIKLTTPAGRETASCSRLRMKFRPRLGPPTVTRVRLQDTRIDVDAFKSRLRSPDSWLQALQSVHLEADLTGALRSVGRYERGSMARTVRGRIDCEATLASRGVSADYPAVLEVMDALESIGLFPSRIDLRLQRSEGSWIGKGIALCENVEIPLSVQADVPGSFRVVAHLPAPGMDIMGADYAEVAGLAELLEVEGVIADDLSAESSVSFVPSIDLSEFFTPSAGEE